MKAPNESALAQHLPAKTKKQMCRGKSTRPINQPALLLQAVSNATPLLLLPCQMLKATEDDYAPDRELPAAAYDQSCWTTAIGARNCSLNSPNTHTPAADVRSNSLQVTL
jgi:hypothetical protein